jgi:hypothetical protein
MKVGGIDRIFQYFAIGLNPEKILAILPSS